MQLLPVSFDCHQQQFAFSDAQQFSIGINGTNGNRNASSLTNVGWNNRLNWDGSAFSLGKRCQRFAMIIQDGTIKEINTEDGPGLDRSSAESILKSI